MFDERERIIFSVVDISFASTAPIRFIADSRHVRMSARIPQDRRQADGLPLALVREPQLARDL